MSDRFSCEAAEKLIPVYVRGGCSEEEKRFLQKHCAECSECSLKLLQEQNKQAHMEGRREPADSPSKEAGKRSAGERWSTGVIVIAAFVILSIAVAAGSRHFINRAVEFRDELEKQRIDKERLGDPDLSNYRGPVELPRGEDHVIDCKDPVLKEWMREATGVQFGDIMYSDVLSITRMEVPSSFAEYDEEEPSEKITDISALAEFKNLKELRINDNEIEDISPLKGLTKLKCLDLGNNRIRNIEALKDMKKLRCLNLNANEISDISPLKDLKELEFLCLRENRISDIGALEDLDCLKCLYLDFNRISDLSSLRKMGSLEKLYLSGNMITDISPLENMENLETLYLDYTRVSDFSPLSGLELLDSLSVSGSHISDVSTLKDLAALSELDLSQNEIREADALKSLTELTYLDLRENPIEDDSVLSGLQAEVLYGNIKNRDRVYLRTKDPRHCEWKYLVFPPFSPHEPFPWSFWRS
jgi:Leucine-rich repeat (LRR) protein